MSIGSLIADFGVSLQLFRPAASVSSDGKPMRTYALVQAFTGFIQPSSQGQEVFEGRQSSRTAVTIYVEGSLDARIDDEIYSASSGTVERWRVTGSINPGEVGRISSSHRLCMTSIDAVQIAPEISI